jgi:hypothetical protein
MTMATLPTDFSPLTLERYADLAAQLSVQFPGRFAQLDCGPGSGVVPTWVSPPTQAELTAFAVTVNGWTWADNLFDALARTGIGPGTLAALTILASASAATLTASQKTRLQNIVNQSATGVLTLVGSLIGT